ncbi:uncharacterized protein LOC117178668 [Belonocnema kinseyi]|uniref:uncharacterized protein LOC117178668 n=1 Tax=Belonocnema kinseyi TaxID=2817044 RepID=UPI00143D0A5A|nr:uncharacterized protein LOC117178668 [Belonocnema kinseyi]
MTPDICINLDRIKISDRKAARILAATLKSLGKNHSRENEGIFDINDPNNYALSEAEEFMNKGAEAQLRSDFKELLELILIFIGARSRESLKFKLPGAVHHARNLDIKSGLPI